MADFLIQVTRRPRGCGRRPHAAAPIAAGFLTAGLVLAAAPDFADGGEPKPPADPGAAAEAPPGLPPGRLVEDLDETAVPSLLSFVRELKAAADNGPRALSEAAKGPIMLEVRDGVSVRMGVDIHYTRELPNGLTGVSRVKVVSSAKRRVNVVYAPSRGGVVSSFNGEFVHDGHVYSCVANFEQDGTFKSMFYYPWGQMAGTRVVATMVSRLDDGRYELIEDFEFDLKNIRFATDPPGEETPNGGARISP